MGIFFGFNGKSHGSKGTMTHRQALARATPKQKSQFKIAKQRTARARRSK